MNRPMNVAPLGRPRAARGPVQDIKVFSIQDRRDRGTLRPWVVRWSLNDRQRARSFRTRAEADRYRTFLLQAQQRGEPFDVATGMPKSWLPSGDDMTVHQWVRQWLAEQWEEWQPRTRASAVEALARFVPLLVDNHAPIPPAGVRPHLVSTLRPGVEPTGPVEQWLDKWSLQLGQLDRSRLAEVERRLALGDQGQPLAASSAARYRKIARACIRRAVELEILDTDPWPPAPAGRSRRKATRVKRSIDTKVLPDPESMRRALDQMVSHQPASRRYQVMTAVAYYAGLRPSEVVMLTASALDLPATGWGAINVTEADISFDEPGEPKTGPRVVPIPEPLVTMLRSWVKTNGFAPGDRLFRTRTGACPTPSNWSRAWKRAQREAGLGDLRLYDLRHAAATTWLMAGVPLGEVASRMGHSVETLVSTYVGALRGDTELANQRIDAVLNGAPRKEGP